MIQTQMLEGTTEEIIRLLLQNYAGQKLRLFIEVEAIEPSTLTEKHRSRSERFVSQPGELIITPPQKSADENPETP